MVITQDNASAIADKIQIVKKQISDAATSAGRLPEDITLIAVSKTRPLASVIEAIAAGQKHFGENTIQDARTKIDQLADNSAIWHFIGHLQTNKAKFLADRFQWLHTLDSVALAKKLNTSLAKSKQKLSVLIQVNVSNDAAKHGIDQKKLNNLIENIFEENLQQIELKGLMTIGKLDASESEQKNAFLSLRDLCEKTANNYNLPNFSELSMGMSKDFEQAIAAGSTMVRVGSQIFGARL
jgi:pyridoxal phosphate enzyme (YggS family)